MITVGRPRLLQLAPFRRLPFVLIIRGAANGLRVEFRVGVCSEDAAVHESGQAAGAFFSTRALGELAGFDDR